MSEHKFKIGDKVMVMGIPTSIGVLAEINPDRKLYPYKIKLDNGDFLMARTDELEPVSDHIDADEIAKLFAETEEKDKKKHTLPNPADLMDEDTQRLIAKVEKENKARKTLIHERTKGYYAGAEDAMKDIQRIKKEEYERGFKAGMKAVIVNVERLLKEITP